MAKKRKSKRFHFVGHSPEGPVYQACNNADEYRTLADATPGEPIVDGETLALVKPDPEDEAHVTMEDVDLHSGPVQVATAAYRAGYDRTFVN